MTWAAFGVIVGLLRWWLPRGGRWDKRGDLFNLVAASWLVADALGAGLTALGAEMGSAEMQAHARLANTYKPQLRTHDRFGHRTDVVEFHPSYHALIGAALRHGLHATPWSRMCRPMTAAPARPAPPAAS